MAASETPPVHGLTQADLDRCIHCGLCLNACPTYRELGWEMDSPRGRIYQMAAVTSGKQAIGPSYLKHIGLCLACRGCESACPSGVRYGHMVEAAREEIEALAPKAFPVRVLREVLLEHVVESRVGLTIAGGLLYLYEASGLRRLVRASGLMRLFGKLGRLEPLTPSAEPPFFFRCIGKTYPPEGERRYRVAFLAGCIANVLFARLNEATVRVLQKNGCEVTIPEGQGCCGALHAHLGLREDARRLARKNIDAVLGGGFDAIITNAAGCGSTIKEYGELLAGDAAYAEKAREFTRLTRDISEFLDSIDLNRNMGTLALKVTYQDSCHLAHGQRIRVAPRRMLAAIPGLQFVEVPMADVCCGSAGVYNIVQDEMAAAILARKMEAVNATGADVLATANPGCLIQLKAGVVRHGRGQRVCHVVELLDEAYRAAPAAK